jgi:hypothetical protein
LALLPTCAAAQIPTGDIARQVSRATSAAVSDQIASRMIRPELRVKNRLQASEMALSPNGRFLAVALAGQAIAVWDVERGREIARLRHAGEIAALAASNTGEVAVGAPDGSVTQLHGEGQQRVAATGSAITALAYDPAAARLAVARTDGAIETRRLADGGVIATYRHGTPVLHVAFAGESVSAVTAAGEVVDVSRSSAAKLSGVRGVARAALTGAGSGLAVTSEGRLVRIDVPKRTTAQVAVEVPGLQQAIPAPREDVALVRKSGGEVELYSLQTRKLLARLLSTSTGWAVMDFEGRYDGSNDTLSDVVWQAGPNAIDLHSFAERYFEPGVLSRYWGGRETTLAKVPTVVERGIVPPPSVEVVLPADSSKQAGAAYQLVVLATDGGGGVNEVRLYHNGRLVDRSSLVQMQDRKAAGKQVRAAVFSVVPTTGVNTFRAVATTAFDLEGRSERVSAEFAGEPERITQHVLVAGVDDYSGPLPDLNYAVADAQVVAEYFSNAPRSEVVAERKVRLLSNAQATKAAILEQLAGMARESQAPDVIVLFLAGHGFSPSADEWRFAPSGAAVSAGKLTTTTISASELQAALAPAKARRILLMIDSCQSTAAFGAFVDQRDFYRRFFTDLSRTQGLGVLTATRADADAVELRELGHGAFTYVVLNGLRGRADARPQDGRVSVLELSSFVERELPDLAYKHERLRQEPGAFSLGADFLIN